MAARTTRIELIPEYRYDPSAFEPADPAAAGVRRSHVRAQVAQTDQPDPTFAMAVNDLQDSVEAFLRLAASELTINLPSHVNFLDYWDRIQPALPGQTGQLRLPSKNAMDRMNKLRGQSQALRPRADAGQRGAGPATT